MPGTTCPTCGAPVEGDRPHGLCPACLLREGLKGDAPPADPLRAALEARLQGQYRLIRLLGRGGMGSVYLARDLTLDREVAIKVVKTAADAADVYERFRREARTAARLAHPNIVPLHAFGEVEGMPYFVMGYVRGESLAARLRRDGRLGEDEARRVLAEIADALDHAHRQGIVHRDVKPDNVLLEDETGRALLTDFGVAKATLRAETMTQAGSVVGTPHYMSPEQASGRGDVDGRSDIYALGVMGYAMIAGRLPFDGGSASEVLVKHLTQQPPPLRTLAPATADAVGQAVDRCLAKDPAQRWPDARSLRQALGAVEESELPDALEGVDGRGLLGAGFVAAFVFAIWRTGPPLAVLPIVVGTFALQYLYLLYRLRREGFPMGQTQAAIWREPKWWPFWYPRRLRRRGNVWDRLPATVRQVRGWLPAFSGYVAAFTLGFVFLNAVVYPPRMPGDVQFRLLLVTVAGIVGFTAAFFFLTRRARRALLRLGVSRSEADRILHSEPPGRPGFWVRPHIAAVLAPEDGGRVSVSDTPHDHLRAILRDAGEISGPLRPLGSEAAVAARQLIVSIEHADREIADLARSLEPGEDARLADKIAALAPRDGAPDEYAPLRALLERQLELVRGLAGRIEQARQRRTRRVEMLKTLALHMATLRARAAETPAAIGSVSERVRALCDDIARQGEAIADADTRSGIDTAATRAR